MEQHQPIRIRDAETENLEEFLKEKYERNLEALNHLESTEPARPGFSGGSVYFGFMPDRNSSYEGASEQSGFENFLRRYEGENEAFIGVEPDNDELAFRGEPFIVDIDLPVQGFSEIYDMLDSELGVEAATVNFGCEANNPIEAYNDAELIIYYKLGGDQYEATVTVTPLQTADEPVVGLRNVISNESETLDQVYSALAETEIYSDLGYEGMFVSDGSGNWMVSHNPEIRQDR